MAVLLAPQETKVIGAAEGPNQLEGGNETGGDAVLEPEPTALSQIHALQRPY